MNQPLSAEQAAVLYGNRFLTEDAPDGDFPACGMSALDAMRLVDEELALEGDPQRNLATFVTTWMEPEAQRIIAENLYRNFIDHAEDEFDAGRRLPSNSLVGACGRQPSGGAGTRSCAAPRTSMASRWAPAPDDQQLALWSHLQSQRDRSRF